MLGAPILEGCVSFPLASGETCADHVKWHDLDLGDSCNEVGAVQVVYDDLNIPYFGNKLTFRFVRPKKSRSAALSAAPNEVQKLARLFR
jgi:hypothetical protein